MSRDEPSKIIVDEDWKSTVDREREQQRQRQNRDFEQAAGPHAAEDGLPPASFLVLVTSLVTQTMAALGQLPDPVTQESRVTLPFARLNIDLLAMLQEKTRGNLTDDEAQMLEDALHQLRMMYVAVQRQQG